MLRKRFISLNFNFLISQQKLNNSTNLNFQAQQTFNKKIGLKVC